MIAILYTMKALQNFVAHYKTELISNYAINPALFAHWTRSHTPVFIGYHNVIYR